MIISSLGKTGHWGRADEKERPELRKMDPLHYAWSCCCLPACLLTNPPHHSTYKWETYTCQSLCNLLSQVPHLTLFPDSHLNCHAYPISLHISPVLLHPTWFKFNYVWFDNRGFTCKGRFPPCTMEVGPWEKMAFYHGPTVWSNIHGLIS